MSGPKEAAYDERINPLMAQIIAICKEQKINMAATFILDPDPEADGDPIACTTVLAIDQSDPIGFRRAKECERVMYGRGQLAAFTITSGPLPSA